MMDDEDGPTGAATGWLVIALIMTGCVVGIALGWWLFFRLT